MKKIILSAVLAAMVLSFTGCGEEAKATDQKVRSESNMPDLNRVADPSKYEKF